MRDQHLLTFPIEHVTHRTLCNIYYTRDPNALIEIRVLTCMDAQGDLRSLAGITFDIVNDA